ncbi:ATP-binding protein [Bhargavaea ullalensis]|uniref:Kinase n=1 Tax=Bhargavaea ullalensis TaxID=1265685 RepID=A0ABV2GB71_9BACL
MTRLAMMTVGKTHSGKTTFAKLLAKELPNTVVIDQDRQAKFLNDHYPQLLPEKGPNRIKHDLTRTLAEYAAEHTNCHLILSNSNLGEKDRREWLDRYKEYGFETVLVCFNLSEDMLRLRIRKSQKSTDVFRVSLTYDDLLERQQKQFPDVMPAAGEADHLFTVSGTEEINPVIGRILGLAGGKGRRT